MLLTDLPVDVIKLIFNSIDFDRQRHLYLHIGLSQVRFANASKVIRQSIGETLRKEARAKAKCRILPLDLKKQNAFTEQLDAESDSKKLIKYFQRGVTQRMFANTLKTYDVLRKDFCTDYRRVDVITRSTVLEFTSNESFIVCICEMAVNYKKQQLTGYSTREPEKQTWLRVFGSDSDHRHALCEVRIPYESVQVEVDSDDNIAVCTHSVSEDLQRVFEYRIQKTGSTFKLEEVSSWSPVRPEDEEEEEDLGPGEDFTNQTSRVVFLNSVVHCVSFRKLDEYTISTISTSRCFHPSKEVDEGVGLSVSSVLSVGGALAIALESGQIFIHDSALNILTVLKTRWRIDKCPDFGSQRLARYNNMAIDSAQFSNNLRSLVVCDRAARIALFKTPTRIFDSSQKSSFGFTSRPHTIQLCPMFQIDLSSDTICVRVEFSFCSRFLLIAANRRQQWKKLDLYDMSCLAFGHSEASASTSPAAITFNSKNSMLVLAREGGLFRLSKIA